MADKHVVSLEPEKGFAEEVYSTLRAVLELAWATLRLDKRFHWKLQSLSPLSVEAECLPHVQSG
jgi:hypothetical protein